ncbi:MAG TPA: ATP-dependent DNA ligase [Patescibacteria group bacterium]
MKISEFSNYLQKLESTASRNEITEILASLFEKSSKEEIDKIVYLSLGTLAPSFRNIIFNIADQMMIRVLAKAYSVDIEKVKEQYREKGDLGTVAYKYAKAKGDGQEVSSVYDKLVEIAKEGGEGSQERRVEKMSNLFKSLDPLSAKFVARIPLGKLRLGFSDLTIIDALSWYEKKDKSGKKELTHAYEVLPDIGLLAKKVKELGIKKATSNPKPVLGIPIAPMLAQRIGNPSEMIKKMGKVAVEPKFDGVRVQIHFKKGKKVHAFTRNLHDISEMFPELEKVGEHLNANEIILDTEGIGIDEKTKSLLDFQTTMTRRRKHEINEFANRIPITFYVFDVMYVNGNSLMDKPYLERREILKKVVLGNSLLRLDEEIATDNPQVISSLYAQKRKEGLEGIMVKKIDSEYVPGRTGWRWVKMKQTELTQGKLTDTVDGVVMGYTVGLGKRASFGLGQFLVGVKDGEQIKTITKVGTGLTDIQFKSLNEKLQKLKVNQKPKEYEVAKILEPDYWVEPQLVVEIAADDITKSPNHTAGYALRFPRLVQLREDKSAKDATTTKEIERLYKLQKK